MLQLARLLRHKHGRLPHNHVSLPFDTLTSVYRDAVHAKEREGVQGELQKEQKEEHYKKLLVWQQPLPEWHNEVEVTNHVGNLGVMSIYRTETGNSKSDETILQSGNVKENMEEENVQIEEKDDQTKRIGKKTTSPLLHLQKGEEHMKEVRWHNEEKECDSVNSGGATNSKSIRKKSTRRLSGVQLEILSLYRHLLKETKRFRDAPTQINMRAHIREQFVKHANIPRRNIIQIEWQINYAKRKLEDMRHMHYNTKFSVMKELDSIAFQ